MKKKLFLASILTTTALAGAFAMASCSSGKNGETPYIGSNGNWWIGDSDTGVKAQGESAVAKNVSFQVASGYIQYQYQGDTTWTNLIALDDLIGAKGDSIELGIQEQNIAWKVAGTDTWNKLVPLADLAGNDGKKVLLQNNEGKLEYKYEGDEAWQVLIDLSTVAGGAKGDPGVSPNIGTNGNWWIGETDTGVKAQGNDGVSPTIGANGNWFIGTTDTGVKASGTDGKNVTFRVNDGYIEYQHDGDSTWTKLVQLTTLKGEKGDPGLSAYQIYIAANPTYTKTEKEWLDDLVNGRLGTVETKKYTVVFDYYTGTKAIEVEEGKTATAITDPERDGYVFKGWYVDGDTEWNFKGDIVSSAITLKAKWAKVYNVQIYDTIENKTIKEESVEEGKSLPTISVPDKTGYRFVGYFNSNSLNENYRVDIANPITSNKTIYLVYEKIAYNIEYNLNNGNWGANSYFNTYKYSTSQTALPVPVREGYKFLGWYCIDGIITSIPAEKTGNLSLEARWELVNYKITFDTAGGHNSNISDFNIKFDYNYEGAPATKTVNVKSGDIINVPDTPQREGYYFRGWYDENDNQLNYNTVTEDGTTYYAKWVETTNDVTVIQNNQLTELSLKSGDNYFLVYSLGEFAMTFSSAVDIYLTYNYGTSSYPKCTEMNRTSYYYGYQLIKINSSEEKVVSAYVYSKGTDCAFQNTSKVINANITYSPNYGTCSKPGYLFDGWYLNDVRVDVARPYYFGSNVTLVAKYIKDEAAITYCNAENFEGEAKEKIEYGQNYIIPTPVRAGYKFLGWYLDPSFTIKAPSEIVGTGDITYIYAKWEIVEANLKFYETGAIITFNVGEGAINCPEPQYVTEDNPAVCPDIIPEKPGYLFLYWADKSTNKYDFSRSLTDDIELTACYIKTSNILKSNCDNLIELKTTNTSFVLNQFRENNLITITLPEGVYCSIPDYRIINQTGVIQFNANSNNYISVNIKSDANGSYNVRLDLDAHQSLSGGTAKPRLVNTIKQTVGSAMYISYDTYEGTGLFERPEYYIVEKNDNVTYNGYFYISYDSTDLSIYIKRNNPRKYRISYSNINYASMDKAIKTYIYTFETYTLPIPTYDDYIFDGWYLESDFSGEKITELSNIKNNVYLYPKLTPKEYNVCFLNEYIKINYHYNDGSDTTILETVDSNYKSKIVVEDYRVCYEWFLDAECTIPFDLSTIKQGTYNVYAKWVTTGALAKNVVGVITEKGTYTLDFAKRTDYSKNLYLFISSGTQNVKFTAIGDGDTYGLLLDADLNILSQQDGGGGNDNFSIDRNIKAGVYFISPTGYYEPFKNYTLEVTTELDYVIPSYSVSLVDKTSSNCDTLFTFPAGPEKEGYTFAYWYNPITNYTYSAGYKTKLGYGVYNLVPLYDANSYDVTYHYGEDYSSTYKTTYYANDFNLSTSNRDYTGYRVVGWRLENDPSAEVFKTISKNQIGNLDLYAVYEKVVYNLEFDLAGGYTEDYTIEISFETGTTEYTIPSIVINVGTSFEMPVINRPGYVGIWYEDEELTKPLSSYEVTGDTTFYIRWFEIKSTYSGLGIGDFINPMDDTNYYFNAFTNGKLLPYYSYSEQDIKFYSQGTTDTVGYLFEYIPSTGSLTQQAYSDDAAGQGANFAIEYTLEANKLYFFIATGYSTKTGYGELVFEAEDNTLAVDCAAKFSLKYAYDEPYEYIAAPKRDGYIFDGWSFSGSTSNHCLTRDSVVKASWRKIEYSIKYVNGMNVLNPVQYNAESETIELLPATKEGFIFSGWYTTDSFDDDTQITEIKKGSYGNITLYAKFDSAYKLTLANTDLDSIYVKANDRYQLKASDMPKKEGYVAVGIYYDSAFTTGISYVDMTSDKTVYVKYEKIVYLFIYGDNGKVKVQEISKYNEGYSIYSYFNEDSYFTIDGFYLDSNYTEEITYIPTLTSNILIVYVKTTAKEYAIHYLDKDDNTILPDGKYNYYTPTAFAEPAPKPGYRFLGWRTYSNDTLIKDTAGKSGELTVYAEYELIEYKITYELDGGTWTNSSSVLKKYSVESYTLYTGVTKEGYTFGGWYLDEECTIPVTDLSSSTGDVKLYAKWVAE